MGRIVLIVLAVVIGWIWMFALLNRIVLWPLPFDVPVSIPDDGRAWRMAHVEAVTEGLLLMAIGLGGQHVVILAAPRAPVNLDDDACAEVTDPVDDPSDDDE